MGMMMGMQAAMKSGEEDPTPTIRSQDKHDASLQCDKLL